VVLEDYPKNFDFYFSPKDYKGKKSIKLLRNLKYSQIKWIPEYNIFLLQVLKSISMEASRQSKMALA
jgi:hypothetical protein